MKFPIPKNQKQLKDFLGLTNFYNRFTDKYAETTQPLLELLKKGCRFIWTPELNNCFQQVKESVSYTHLDVYNRQGLIRDRISRISVGKEQAVD